MTRAPEAPGRAAPYVIVGLFLLSIPTIAYAILIHAFGCGDACTSTNLEGEIELILAYVNLA